MFSRCEYDKVIAVFGETIQGFGEIWGQVRIIIIEWRRTYGVEHLNLVRLAFAFTSRGGCKVVRGKHVT